MKAFLTMIFYYLNVTWVKALIFCDTKRVVEGLENVPRTGPFILTSNHLNNADSPIITGTTPRRIAWLTKAEWFRTPFIGWMFSAGGMIPVHRGEADLRAVRAAQDALKRGLVLGMFPEGHRSKDGVLHKGAQGSAMIALRTGAPILPMAIWETEKVHLPKDLFKRNLVHLRYGKPFTLPRPEKIRREDIQQATETIMREIAALLPEKYRGAYAEASPPSPLSRAAGEGENPTKVAKRTE